MRRLTVAILLLCGTCGTRSVAVEEPKVFERLTEADKSAVITMEKFVVSASFKGARWRYVEAPGLTVLSACPDDVTKLFVEAFLRAVDARKKAFPQLVTGEFASRDTVLLCQLETDGSREGLSQAVTGDGLVREPGGSPGAKSKVANLPPLTQVALSVGHGGRSANVTLLNLRLPPGKISSSADVARRMAQRLGGGEGANYFLRAIALERRPPLPLWMRDLTMEPVRLLKEDLSLGRLFWNSAAETERLRQDWERNRPALLPLDQLLSSRRMSVTEGVQGALFVRWALLADKGAHAAGFWKLVDRTGAEPVTEEMLRECFGLTVAELNARLLDYLRVSVDKDFSASFKGKATVPRFQVRDAASVEVARITGAFEREQAFANQARDPELAQGYRDVARRTLLRGHKNAPADGGVIAQLGVLEFDSGNTENARELLEAAFRKGTQRPEEYLHALAQLRQQAIEAEKGAGSGPWTREQLTEVLDPLLAARAEPPVSARTLTLMATAWRRSGIPPNQVELAALIEESRRFSYATAPWLIEAVEKLQLRPDPLPQTP